MASGERMEHYVWENLEKEVLGPSISRRVISGERITLAQFFLAKGAVVPEHRHENEQIACVLEGALRFQVGGREVVVSAGETLVIPSMAPHSAVALEDTIDLDVFSPVRSDWLAKQDSYLRG
jgi:quercetin dioxygenase-like cupin family protein